MAGGLAADILRGGTGDDRIFVGAGDRACGGGGVDTFTLGWTSPSTIETLIDGGEGVDSLTLTTGATIVIGADGFTYNGATFRSIEALNFVIYPQGCSSAITIDVTGGAGSDTLTANTSSSASTTITFRGGAGDDVLTTNTTRLTDRLEGGAGNDIITGKASCLARTATTL